MVERRRRNLDGTFLGSVGVRGQNAANQRALLCDYKLLIVERKVVPFRDQRGDLFLFEKELIEPRDLRQHLQIGEILILKISLRALGMISMLAKPLPELARSEERRVG